MSHLPLDARAILHYLNELVYRNISAAQLKEFLKDLRKLIKYEERMGINTQQNDYYESLFRRTTASYRAKTDKENDTRGKTKRKSFDSVEPTSSRQAPTENRKVLGERNHGETSISSYDLLEIVHKSLNQSGSSSSKNQTEKFMKETKTDTRSIKAYVEDTLTQVLRDKYSQKYVEKRDKNIAKDKTSVKSIVEQVLKEKFSDLRHLARERLNSFENGSLRSNIEDIIVQVLEEKLADLERETEVQRKPENNYNKNKSLDSRDLVQQLLAIEDKDNEIKEQKKNSRKLKSDKENSTTPPKVGCIKRLNRSSKKKPEWQDPRPQDNILDKAQRPLRSHSPVASSTGRSKCSSGVLIRRSVSQGRHNKPNSDPVALYQYYKNEWEHFRKQIPGETPHNRLRWQVRQHLLDPE